MKKLIAMLALLAFTGNMAGAELLKNFKYDGKIEVNSWQMRNADFDETANDKRNDTDTRVRVDMGFDLNDDADAVVTLSKANRQYGDAKESVNNLSINTVLQQAYLDLKGVLGIDHKLGRQYYGEEGDLILYVGPRGWPYRVDRSSRTNYLGADALDGWTGWYTNGKLDINTLMSRREQGNVTVNADGEITSWSAADRDQHIWGFAAGYKLADDMKLRGYYYRKDTQAGVTSAAPPTTPGPDNRLGVVGAKASGKFMGFTYGAELAKNTGNYNNLLTTGTSLAPNNVNARYSGSAMKFNAGYELDAMGKWAFTGEYARGTGDTNVLDGKVKAFYGIMSDYRPGVIWGGEHIAAGQDGVTNLKTWNLGARWTPEALEKLTVSGKLLGFAPAKKPPVVAPIVKTYDAYGTEFDLCAKWQHSENLGVKAYYARFTPEKNYARRNSLAAKDDATTVLGAAFNVKF